MSYIKIATFDKDKNVVSVLSGDAETIHYHLQNEQGFHAFVPENVYSVTDVPPVSELELIPHG